VNAVTSCFLNRRSSLGIHAAVFAVMVCSAATAAAADAEVPPLVRVRSNSPALAAVIDDATVRSPLFRRLRKTIDATDGLVYVDDGICGRSVVACLALTVQVAGPHRVLRIVVDTNRRKNDCDLMASIGHELWHAIELLNEPNVRDYYAAYSFFDREAPTDRVKNRFETSAAIRTGLSVLREVCPR
jgi:hypothetical protein